MARRASRLHNSICFLEFHRGVSLNSAMLLYSCGVLRRFVCFMERPKPSTSAALGACPMPKPSLVETLLCGKIVQKESILQHIRELSPKKGRNKVRTNFDALCFTPSHLSRGEANRMITLQSPSRPWRRLLQTAHWAIIRCSCLRLLPCYGLMLLMLAVLASYGLRCFESCIVAIHLMLIMLFCN